MSIRALRARGIEVHRRSNGLFGRDKVSLPEHSKIEAPSSLKWTQYVHSLELGAFSYQVSGYAFAVRIGRYCSFGENVQIGRQNHPLHLISTSPAFYLHDRLFDLGDEFPDAANYHRYKFKHKKPTTQVRVTHIGHDVWIGHGAYIAAGVKIGNGAVIAGHAVVSRDVPPYAVVAGNPAVVKKYRFDEATIAALERHRWWRFAPWQLTGLDIGDTAAFLKGIEALPDADVFRPDIVDLSQEKP